MDFTAYSDEQIDALVAQQQADVERARAALRATCTEQERRRAAATAAAKVANMSASERAAFLAALGKAA